MNLLYLVVDGNFTPLLGCDVRLDLEVLQFMNLQLIDTPVPNPAMSDMPRACGDQTIFQKDLILSSADKNANDQKEDPLKGC